MPLYVADKQFCIWGSATRLPCVQLAWQLATMHRSYVRFGWSWRWPCRSTSAWRQLPKYN